MNSILNEESVPQYLADHESDIGVFSSDSKISAKSILGGNVNYAFRAVDENDESKSVFVKQAPEYVAIFGPDGFPLTSARMNQEIAVYNQWRYVLGSETKYLPKIYFFDSESFQNRYFLQSIHTSDFALKNINVNELCLLSRF